MKGDDLAERLLEFSARVLCVVRELPKDLAARHVAGQLTRAGTSGGANYEEAPRAESRNDFTHKVLIAAKEIGESVYWLPLIERSALIPGERLRSLIDEGRALAAILNASARTARAGSATTR